MKRGEDNAARNIPGTTTFFTTTYLLDLLSRFIIRHS